MHYRVGLCLILFVTVVSIENTPRHMRVNFFTLIHRLGKQGVGARTTLEFFEPSLDHLNYPGLSNPLLVIITMVTNNC